MKILSGIWTAVKVMFGVFAVLMVVAIVTRPSTKPSKPQVATTQATEEKPVMGTYNPLVISARDLASAYERNELRADGMYKGKLLLVTGRIDSITQDLMDDTVISIEGTNEFLGIHASIDDSEVPKAANLNKRDKITVLCLGNGEVGGTPMLNECIIQ